MSTATVLLVTVAACGLEDAGTVAAPESPQIIEMRCGAVSAPWSDEAQPLGDTEDPDLDLALDWFAGNEEGRFWVDTVEWSVWEKTADRMVLYGISENGFADATFIRDGDTWAASGWGGCHWMPHREGWGLAEWRLEERVDPGATALTLAVTERNCASGEAPTGRAVEPVIVETEETVTIVVLVEPVSGPATCPSNPEFSWTVILDSPIGDRVLIDGSVIPPMARERE